MMIILNTDSTTENLIHSSLLPVTALCFSNSLYLFTKYPGLMSLFRFSSRVKIAADALSSKMMLPRFFVNPGLELCPVGSNLQSPNDSNPHSLSELINDIWLMAAPKSKVNILFYWSNSLFDKVMLISFYYCFMNSQVTNMKKKRKHISYIPTAKGWSVCPKCGEAKLPHRICKKHLEVCAMRDAEWKEKKLTLRKEQSSSD